MGSAKRNITIGVGGLILVLAVVQLVSLLNARLDVGDTYEAYSTLRADPVGTMALYNALDALPDVDTLRYVRPFEELPKGRDTTLVIAGAALGLDSTSTLESLEDFVVTGGRAVIAFRPLDDDFSLYLLRESIRARDKARLRKAGLDKQVSGDKEADDSSETPANESTEEVGPEKGPAPPTEESDVPSEDKSGGDAKEEDDDDEEDLDILGLTPTDLKSEDISERWDFDYGFGIPLDDGMTTRANESIPVEEKMRLRSGLYFEPEGDGWTPVYTRADENEDDTPICTLMVRDFGEGSIVLCSDAYFLSNEALRINRAPALLQWVLGDNRALFFSETHLGNGQQDRIMTLVRRYRLHGLLGGLLLVGVLFIWKNVTTLIPRRERSLAMAAEREQTQSRGLDNLLTRFVSPSALIALCVHEWRQQFSNAPAAPSVERAYTEMGDSVEATKGEETIVAMYNQLAREVQKRKS